MKYRITNYCVAYGFSIQEIQKNVNANLKEGWELYGNLIAQGLGDETEYYQVMTKSELSF